MEVTVRSTEVTFSSPCPRGSLVIKRTVGETIFIDDHIVELVELGFGFARIKVTARKDVPVFRGEQYQERMGQPVRSALPVIPLAPYRNKKKAAA